MNGFQREAVSVDVASRLRNLRKVARDLNADTWYKKRFISERAFDDRARKNFAFGEYAL